jgi:hypothetical protein
MVCLQFLSKIPILELRYFFVSYVKILRFYKKKFLIGPLLRGGTIFPRSPRTTRNEKKF